jgi:ATP phosphoribosyltransferase
VVLESWAVFIANPSVKGEVRESLLDLVHAFESVENALHKRYLMANVASGKLAEIIRLIPGLKSPTVVSLAQEGQVAVHAVVEEAAINALLPKLQKAGATGILVLPIERMVP